MADEKEKRTLLGDIQKNIIDKIGNENIMEGDITRYKIPKKFYKKFTKFTKFELSKILAEVTVNRE